MTSIEWTHVPDGKGGRKKGETVNPQVGCSEISPGCRNCYAARVAARGMTSHHRGLTVLRSNGPHWNGEIARAPDQLAKPLRWRAPRGIFWGSMTDLFHESCVATEEGRRYIAACFGVMAATPQHTHMVVTKRPDKMREWFEWLTNRGWLATDGSRLHGAEPNVLQCTDALRTAIVFPRLLDPVYAWPLPNVWLLTTTEDQQRANERIPELLACPAAVHGVSVEPMLGPVTLPQEFIALGNRGWAICGGESGNGARPMHPNWARGIRDQCSAAGVPFFFKQWGAFAEKPDAAHGESGRVILRDGPVEARMIKLGKGKSGRVLDGRTRDEFPEVAGEVLA